MAIVCSSFGNGRLAGAELVVSWEAGGLMRLGWRKGNGGMYIELTEEQFPMTPGQWEKMLEIFQIQIDRLPCP